MRAKKDEGKNDYMVIQVTRDESGKVIIRKPPGSDAGPLSDDYNVFMNPEKQPEIYVRWHPNLPCPVIFQFDADEPITSIGFANCECCEVEQYKRKGPCGGSFFLRTDLSRGGRKKVEVENWGHNRTSGYFLKFRVGGTIFDPQIYNEGELPPPGDDDVKRSGCLGRFLGLAG